MLPLNLLREVAARQHGLATPEQAFEVEFTRQSLERTIQRGHIIRLTPNLLVMAGAPDTLPRRLMAATLDAGPTAALSHGTGAAWWGVPGWPYRQLHVVRHRDNHDRPARLSTVHEVRHVPEHHVRVLEGIRVVTPARIPFELANAGEHPKRVERMLDNAWSRNLLNHWAMVAMIDDMSERGRTGMTLIRALMTERGPDYVPPASGLEARFSDIITTAGLPPMDRQVDTSGETGWIGRVDFRARDLPLIAEVQSERFHSSLVDSRSDEARMDALRAAGFVVVEVTDLEVWHNKPKVVSDMTAGFLEARRRAA